MKINRIKKLLVSVLVCSMAFGNISYIPTMAKENVQNYGLNNPTTDFSSPAHEISFRISRSLFIYSPIILI